jgi:phosphopantothenoylcysteine decarboxylase/phosphopantothenate--cysteine ligase
MSDYRKHIIIGITGSIAAYKAAGLVSMLKKADYDVKCIVTEHALKFIGQAALEALSRGSVYSDMFEHPHRIDHISLADWSDLTLVYPATADTIARLRAGRAYDLLSAVFLAQNFSSPWWIAPAMNTNMLEHPAVAENLATLERWGVRIIEPESGTMACGSVGRGRLIEPEAMFALIHNQEIGS